MEISCNNKLADFRKLTENKRRSLWDTVFFRREFPGRMGIGSGKIRLMGSYEIARAFACGAGPAMGWSTAIPAILLREH